MNDNVIETRSDRNNKLKSLEVAKRERDAEDSEEKTISSQKKALEGADDKKKSSGDVKKELEKSKSTNEARDAKEATASSQKAAKEVGNEKECCEEAESHGGANTSARIQLKVMTERLKKMFKEDGSQKAAKEEESESENDSEQKQWKMGPLAQINATSIEVAGNKAINVVIDVSPYELSHPEPLQHYNIINGKLTRTEGNTRPFKIARRQDQSIQKDTGNKDKVNIVSANLQAWTRVAKRGRKPNCHCNQQYFKNNVTHDNADYCKAAAIAAHIAEEMWANKDIIGMEFPEELLE